MSGARTMQELKYFRDGATLVISLDGFNWLPKKRCSDKEIKKRNEELQLFISSDQMVQADEKLQTITRILDQRGTASSELWRKTDCRSRLVTSPKPISTPAQHQTSTLTSFVSFVPDYPKDTPWTRLSLSMQDIFSLIKRDSNMVTSQDCVTMNQLNSFIIFCDEDIPLQRFGDITAEDWRTSKGDTDWHFSDTNMLSDLKDFTAHAANTKNSNRNTQELVIRDSFNNLKSLLRSYQICDSPGELSRTNMDVKRRKSVSFHDEVIVFLFDQAWSGKTTSQRWRRTAIFSVSHTLSLTPFPCQHRPPLLYPGISISPKPAFSSPMSPRQTLSHEIKKTASLGLMEKLTNRADLVLFTFSLLFYDESGTLMAFLPLSA
ncbi:uncharacterized protein [Pseudochaenichthys georgianus]|uniref:uncharacterized protein isoform X1 n=1 Tax=Pseudochaenichthys georgianus TaxID=52239 RepID=UPI0039C1493E